MSSALPHLMIFLGTLLRGSSILSTIDHSLLKMIKLLCPGIQLFSSFPGRFFTISLNFPLKTFLQFPVLVTLWLASLACSSHYSSYPWNTASTSLSFSYCDLWLSSWYVFPGLQSWASYCLLNCSNWIFYRQFKFSLFKAVLILFPYSLYLQTVQLSTVIKA